MGWIILFLFVVILIFVFSANNTSGKTVIRQVKRQTFTAIDVETANSNFESICQIGIVKVVDDVICSTQSFLIQPPGNEYSARNVLIHGISPLTTKDSPLFPEIWPQIEECFKYSKIVAHNANFDVRVIQESLSFYNIESPYIISECTYRLTGLNLKDACMAYRIELENHHYALSDAIACANLYVKIFQGVSPDMSRVLPHKTINPYAGHEKLTGEILKPDLVNADPGSPFYNKKVVITGVYDRFSRDDLQKILKNLGADLNGSVSSKTNFLICGESCGPSKFQKAEAFIKNGADLKIIDENSFLEMVRSYKSGIV